MKKKSIVRIVLLLCGILLLTACAESKEPAAAEKSDVTETDTAAVSAPIEENVVSAAETAASSVSEEDNNIDSAGCTVFFGLEDTVEYEDVCEMSDLYAEVLDDEAMADGWYYYYTDSDESPAPIIDWNPSDGNYTTVEVLFTVKNISDRPQTFGDKITARMLYQENEDSQTEIHEGTVFQQNPGQVDENGEVIMWSTKPVEIDAGESANVSFRFDITKDVYEKIYAAAIGEDTEIIETCEFGFGDGTTFVIDLVKSLIPASKYEW